MNNPPTMQILRQAQDDVPFYAFSVKQTVMLADFGKCAVCPKGTQHVLRRNLIRVNFLHSKKERVEKFRAANNPRSGFQHLTGMAFSAKCQVCKILNTDDYHCAPDLSLQDDRSFLYFKIRLLVFYSLFNLRFLPVSGGGIAGVSYDAPCYFISIVFIITPFSLLFNSYLV